MRSHHMLSIAALRSLPHSAWQFSFALAFISPSQIHAGHAGAQSLLAELTVQTAVAERVFAQIDRLQVPSSG
jgi:hypothetical protein